MSSPQPKSVKVRVRARARVKAGARARVFRPPFRPLKILDILFRPLYIYILCWMNKQIEIGKATDIATLPQ